VDFGVTQTDNNTLEAATSFDWRHPHVMDVHAPKSDKPKVNGDGPVFPPRPLMPVRRRKRMPPAIIDWEKNGFSRVSPQMDFAFDPPLGVELRQRRAARADSGCPAGNRAGT